MNKKLVVGIIAGVAVLLAIVVAILAITGTFGKIDKDGTPSSSSVSGTVSSNVNSSNKDNNSSDGNSSDGDTSEDKRPDTEITVEAKKAKKNSIISIPVVVKNNPGFFAGTFAFKFNTDELTYVDYENGEILDEHEVAVNGNKITALLNSSKKQDVKKDGTVIILNFKVKSPTKNNEYKITIDGEGTMLGSFETGQEVTADISMGTPTVKK